MTGISFSVLMDWVKQMNELDITIGEEEIKEIRENIFFSLLFISESYERDVNAVSLVSPPLRSLQLLCQGVR